MAKLIVANQKEEVKELIDIRPKSMDSLIIKANDIALHSNDYVVKNATTKNIRFNETAGITFIPDDPFEEYGIQSLSISKYALSQLATKIGVPARYLEKCISSGRIDLAQDNINSWLEDYNKDLFIREHKGNVRGILSNRYSVCDSHDILKAVDDALDLRKYNIKGSFLNEERLHVRLISKEMLPIANEDLFAGIFIDSSDVGRSILTVKFGIYKQVCTNGLVIAKAGGTLFEQRHIGITAEEFHEGLTKSLSNVELLTENTMDFIKKARNDNYIISQENLDSYINSLRNITNLSVESASKVIDLMQTKYSNTKWGLINGITEVAQDFTLERRLELERIAGSMLVA